MFPLQAAACAVVATALEYNDNAFERSDVCKALTAFLKGKSEADLAAMPLWQLDCVIVMHAKAFVEKSERTEDEFARRKLASALSSIPALLGHLVASPNDTVVRWLFRQPELSMLAKRLVSATRSLIDRPKCVALLAGETAKLAPIFAEDSHAAQILLAVLEEIQDAQTGVLALRLVKRCIKLIASSSQVLCFYGLLSKLRSFLLKWNFARDCVFAFASLFYHLHSSASASSVEFASLFLLLLRHMLEALQVPEFSTKRKLKAANFFNSLVRLFEQQAQNEALRAILVCESSYGFLNALCVNEETRASAYMGHVQCLEYSQLLGDAEKAKVFQAIAESCFAGPRSISQAPLARVLALHVQRLRIHIARQLFLLLSDEDLEHAQFAALNGLVDPQEAVRTASVQLLCKVNERSRLESEEEWALLIVENMLRSHVCESTIEFLLHCASMPWWSAIVSANLTSIIAFSREKLELGVLPWCNLLGLFGAVRSLFSFLIR
jgi:hypothetical protein